MGATLSSCLLLSATGVPAIVTAYCWKLLCCSDEVL